MRAVIAGAAVAAVLAVPGMAAAGQYEVHSCRLPDGTPIGLVGWLPNGQIDPLFGREDHCGGGGGYFEASMHPAATQASDAKRGWELRLGGTGVSLRRLRAHVAMTTRAPGGGLGHIVDALAFTGQGNFSIANGARRGLLDRWDDFSNFIDTGVITAADGYVFGVRCQGGGGTCPPVPGPEQKAYVRVFRTEATLEDLVDPEVASFGGAIAAAGAHRGREGFTLRASDRGAGVYRLKIELDGHEALNMVIDDNAGQCRDQVPGGSAYDFIAPIPCKGDVDGAFELDTTQIPDGRYRARFGVEDAAGNERVALGAIDGWEVDNVPPPSISGAPYVTGSATVGSTLRCEPGAWNFHGAPQVGGFEYRWESSPDGAFFSPLLGEYGATYVVDRSDIGHVLRCVVTARSTEGALAVPSGETRRVPALAATSAPPRSDVRTSAELYLGCGRRALSLISATARGGLVRLAGVVAARYRDSRIAIYDSGRRVATTRARSDGFFDALVPRPSRRRFARARFQAGVAGVRSVGLKLPQDLATTTIGLAGSRTIEIAGAVRHRGYRGVVVRRILCGRYTTVARGLTDGNGRYRIRFAAPRARAGLYRVETRVRGQRAYARARAIDLGDPQSG